METLNHEAKQGAEVLLCVALATSKIKFTTKARKREGRREEDKIHFSSSRLPSLISRDFLFSWQDFLAAKKRRRHKKEKTALWEVRSKGRMSAID